MAELLPELKRGRRRKYSLKSVDRAIRMIASGKTQEQASEATGIPRAYLSKLYKFAREKQKALQEEQGLSSEASSESSDTNDTSAREDAETLKSEV